MPWRAILNPDTAGAADTRLRERPNLDRDDISAFSQALAAARNQFTHAVKGVTAEYDLGPRAPWIIGIVGKTAVSPHQLADFFLVGRSLITAEITRLVDAGLIEQTKNPQDARRITLSLTPAGVRVWRRLEQEIDEFMTERLAGYTVEEIRLCARMLADFSRSRND